MASIKDLKRYRYYSFSSGPYTGEDYKTFQNKYINYLRSMCKNNGWELVNICRGHYWFSVFVKDDYKCVYVSIPDVIGCNNEWCDRILIRCAKDENDCHGSYNYYTSLDELNWDIYKRLKRWDDEYLD